MGVGETISAGAAANHSPAANQALPEAPVRTAEIVFPAARAGAAPACGGRPRFFFKSGFAGGELPRGRACRGRLGDSFRRFDYVDGVPGKEPFSPAPRADTQPVAEQPRHAVDHSVAGPLGLGCSALRAGYGQNNTKVIRREITCNIFISRLVPRYIAAGARPHRARLKPIDSPNRLSIPSSGARSFGAWQPRPYSWRAMRQKLDESLERADPGAIGARIRSHPVNKHAANPRETRAAHVG